MKKFAGILVWLLLSVVTVFAQVQQEEKLPPLFKERRSGKVMFSREQAMREINRERLEHSNAIFMRWGGKLCPVFACKDLEGKEWTNANIRGKVTLINFWHTGAAPSIREIPWLNKLAEKYPRANFLACTFNTPAQIKKIVEETSFLFPQLTEAKAVWQAFGVDISPTAIILNKEGKVFAVVTGANDSLKRAIEEKLKEAYK